MTDEVGVCEAGARQAVDYLHAVYNTLGVMPTQQTLVMERFFDETGGMHVVVHSPFGSRLNRAWGLALRKRFCRSFQLRAAGGGERRRHRAQPGTDPQLSAGGGVDILENRHSP